jgi:hypothetical protein
MSARDFIDDTLLPWLESEIRSEARGNKHYIAGFEDAMKGMIQFIQLHRARWDTPE